MSDAKERDDESTFVEFESIDMGPAPCLDEDDLKLQAVRLREKMFGIEPNTKFGPYRILRTLGHGGMGIVYLAIDPRLDRVVALKTVRDRRYAEQLKSEARALAQLSHPNIVPIHDFGVENSLYFIVMEYVEGVTLKEWRTIERRTISDILDVFSEAGEGLAYAHARGLVHRDFKPANVMLGSDGRVRVMDFGLARTDPGSDKTEVQRADAMGARGPAFHGSGTPAYMAPEQYRGIWSDPRSDQFSFSVALYEALYDQRPFSGDDIGEIQDAAARGDLCRPSGTRDISDTLHRILERGLSPDPRDRFPSMRSLLNALSMVSEQLVASEALEVPKTVRDGTETAHDDRSSGNIRGPAFAVVAAAAVLTIVAGAFFAHQVSVLKDDPSVMHFFTCRAEIVKIDPSQQVRTVKVIDLKSGEVIVSELAEGNTVIFECPASTPVEVKIIVAYTDGTNSSWTVSVYPLTETILLDDNNSDSTLAQAGAIGTSTSVSVDEPIPMIVEEPITDVDDTQLSESIEDDDTLVLDEHGSKSTRAQNRSSERETESERISGEPEEADVGDKTDSNNHSNAPSDASSTQLPNQLTVAEIMPLARDKSRECGKQHGGSMNSIKVNVSVEPSGKLSIVNVEKRYALSETGVCIESELKKLLIPKSANPAQLMLRLPTR